MRKLDDDRVNSGEKIQEDLEVIVTKLITSKSSDLLSELVDLDDEDATVGVMAMLKLVKDFGRYTKDTSEDLIEIRKGIESLSKEIVDLNKRLDKLDELSEIKRKVDKLTTEGAKK